MNAVYYKVYSYHIHRHEGQVGKGFHLDVPGQNKIGLQYIHSLIYIFTKDTTFSRQIFSKICDQKTNQIALLSTEGDRIHCVITSQTKYS